MIDKDGKKFACAACIRGHRVSNCTHKDRALQEVAKKGRPVTQCKHCRSLRVTRAAHSKCDCGENAHAAGACPKLKDTDRTKSEACCCSHGARCTCSLKKEPQLDPVSEYDSEGMLNNSPCCHGLLAERPKLNLSKSEGSSLTIFSSGGHHKPAHKHNQLAHTSGLPYTISRAHSAKGESAIFAKLRAAEGLGVKILPKPIPERPATAELAHANTNPAESSSAESDVLCHKDIMPLQEQSLRCRDSPNSDLDPCHSVPSNVEQINTELLSHLDTEIATATNLVQENVNLSPQVAQSQELSPDYAFSSLTQDGPPRQDFEDYFQPPNFQPPVDWAQYSIPYNNDSQFTTSEFSHAQSFSVFNFGNFTQATLTTPSTLGDQPEMDDVGLGIGDLSSCPPRLNPQYSSTGFNDLCDYSSASSFASMAQYQSQPTTNSDYDEIDIGELMRVASDGHLEGSGTVLPITANYDLTKFAETNPFEGNMFPTLDYMVNPSSWDLAGSSSNAESLAPDDWRVFEESFPNTEIWGQ